MVLVARERREWWRAIRSSVTGVVRSDVEFERTPRCTGRRFRFPEKRLTATIPTPRSHWSWRNAGPSAFCSGVRSSCWASTEPGGRQRETRPWRELLGGWLVLLIYGIPNSLQLSGFTMSLGGGAGGHSRYRDRRRSVPRREPRSPADDGPEPRGEIRPASFVKPAPVVREAPSGRRGLRNLGKDRAIPPMLMKRAAKPAGQRDREASSWGLQSEQAERPKGGSDRGLFPLGRRRVGPFPEIPGGRDDVATEHGRAVLHPAGHGAAVHFDQRVIGEIGSEVRGHHAANAAPLGGESVPGIPARDLRSGGRAGRARTSSAASPWVPRSRR